MKNPELLREILKEAYRKKCKDEEILNLYKNSINDMKYRTDISQGRVDILLSFISGRCKKIMDMIDLYFKK